MNGEFWVATHETWPGDPAFIPWLDDFGEPRLMSLASERAALEIDQTAPMETIGAVW